MPDMAFSMTLGQLKHYREAIFPPSVSQRDHSPFFSLERLAEWVTESGKDCFKPLYLSSEKENLPAPNAPINPSENDINIIREYRSFILPPGPSTSENGFEMFQDATDDYERECRPPSPASSAISGNFGYDWANWDVDQTLLDDSPVTEQDKQDREEAYALMDQFMIQYEHDQ